MARKKRQVEEKAVVTEEPVVVEEPTPEAIEPLGSTESVAESTPDPVVSTSSAQGRNRVVILRYSGQNATKDLADVPSGSKYRVNSNGIVSVYQTDVETLLARKGFSQV